MGFFSQFAQSWSDPNGPMVFLHRMQAARIAFIEKAISECSSPSLYGLDLGAGLGLVSEELAKKGHLIDSVELEKSLCEEAQKRHMGNGLSDRVRVICSSAETYAPSECYDFIVCLEMLEHVDNPQELCQKMISWLKPGGSLILSTLNRTNCAYFTAILGAEWILNILPKGTHDFQKFITPEELNHWTDPLLCRKIKGLIYNPLEKQFFLGESLSVNYIGHWKDMRHSD